MTRAQILGQQVQVSLRRRDLRVAEHHREPDDVATVAEVVRREGVPEPVPAECCQRKFLLQDVQPSKTVALIPGVPSRDGNNKAHWLWQRDARTR